MENFSELIAVRLSSEQLAKLDQLVNAAQSNRTNIIRSLIEQAQVTYVPTTIGIVSLKPPRTATVRGPG